MERSSSSCIFEDDYLIDPIWLTGGLYFTLTKNRSTPISGVASVLYHQSQRSFPRIWYNERKECDHVENGKNAEKLSKQPLRLQSNRVWRTYQGGRQIEEWQGLKSPADGDFPEEWVASTVQA